MILIIFKIQKDLIIRSLLGQKTEFSKENTQKLAIQIISKTRSTYLTAQINDLNCSKYILIPIDDLLMSS